MAVAAVITEPGSHSSAGPIVAALPSTAELTLLPDRRHPNGPVTSSRLRRSLLVYAAIWSGGVALIASGMGMHLSGIGLALIAPGGNLLLHGHWLLEVLVLGLFAISLVLWLGSGNVLAPLAVWVGPLLAEAVHTPGDPWTAVEWLLPALAAAAVIAGLAGRQLAFQGARRRAARRNAHLRERIDAERSSGRRAPQRGVRPQRDGAELRPHGVRPRGGAPQGPVGPELTADELALARFTLDRALQPVPEFGGFDRLEQFQTSSIRYQVNVAGYALAALQYSRAPAFHGYLSEAQRNLIAKAQERVCWAYWSKESLWGHLRYNPDPIPRDNIMVSGWLGYQLAGYVSNTGDERYNERGSISFRHPRGQSYDYDLHSITETLTSNFEASDFCLFPCEPNWIYALCNGFGILPLPIHDRLFGTDYWERVGDSFREGFEREFMTVDGRTIGIRSSLTGFTVPAMTSVLSDCSVIWQLSPVLPELARRSWEIARSEWVRPRSDGSLDVKLSGWDKIDTGNYRRVPISAYIWILAAAEELGDSEVAAGARAEIEARFSPITEDGVKRYADGSVQGNLGLLLSQVAMPGAHSRRINEGMPEAWARGPILDGADYPQVLVARAVSDGEALELVLRPGDGGGRRTLELARLVPGRSYRLEGAVQSGLVASDDGRARFDVDLHDRLEVRALPGA